MKTLSLIASGIAVAGVVAASSAVYTVGEVEQAIITQFGKPVGAPITEAGLKLKCPSSEFFGMLRQFRNGGSGSISVSV
ncbi:hypothetical protein [uncultured Aliiroseovarius sp.]|uniref:hypothetical protein n=1 Tax=uncultured Aliiroseovarius sp. TaxID=1658783 RepID=UPI0025971918|nr:hypothetical protein [uncultured Aliiroseovarius sp.]